jgi:2-desacetyl-2-hydroxyethyl bacteriochlorophyllide A dehydrogenase
MKQLVLAAPGRFDYRTVEAPAAVEGEAIVRIERIGVCGSDFHAFSGSHPAYVYPRVLGHELAGTIVSAPANDRGIVQGDRCAVEPYLNCEQCRMCQIGRTNCCERLEVFGVHRDGGMQSLLAVPLRLLHRSEKLSLEELALVETLGIGAHAVARSELKAHETALVVGAGPIGLGTAMFARLAGASVTLVERNQDRASFASKLGWKVVASAEDHFDDIVFDATGNTTAMKDSMTHVATGGKLVYVGLTSDYVQLDDSRFHKREITLFASRNSAHQFPRIISLLETGAISVKEWVTHRLNMSELPARFDSLPHQANLIKAMVTIEPNAGL